MTSQMLEIALSYMEGLDCAESLKVCILLRAGQLGDIFREENPDPSHYLEHSAYAKAAAAVAFFSKFETNDPAMLATLEEQAIEKWFESERSCFKTNERLNEFMDFGTLNGLPAHDGIVTFVANYRKALYQMLGSRPPDTLDGAFGPGATVSDRSGQTTVPNKMSTVPTYTNGSVYYLVPWLGTKWCEANAAAGSFPIVTRGNVFFTVPKKALARRSCAKEPSVNSFYQRGYGIVMRKRLKAFGLDLTHGQQIHRQVACEASLNGEFATIDLKSASDTISTALVRLGLPIGWFEPLDDLRSHYTLVKRPGEREGRWHRLEKFSSMGNGFTFELETAIFASIILGVRPEYKAGRDFWVYGDDIIIPTEAVTDVIAALKFCGLQLNPTKSFTTGPFRESCGGDYFDGHPVRGYYLKKEPSAPEDFISLANGIRKVALTLGGFANFHRSFLRSWFQCLDNIPSSIRRCRGPEGLGDIVIHDSEDRWSKRWRDDVQRDEIRAYLPTPQEWFTWDRFDPHIQLASVLYGAVWSDPRVGSADKSRTVSCKGMAYGYREGWVLPFLAEHREG